MRGECGSRRLCLDRALGGRNPKIGHPDRRTVPAHLLEFGRVMVGTGHWRFYRTRGTYRRPLWPPSAPADYYPSLVNVLSGVGAVSGSGAVCLTRLLELEIR